MIKEEIIVNDGTIHDLINYYAQRTLHRRRKKHRKLWPNYFKCRKWQNSFPLLNFQLLKIRSAMQKHLGLPVDGVIKRTCFFGSFLWHRHLTWLTCGLYPYHVHIDRQLYNTDTYYAKGCMYWCLNLQESIIDWK